ncbi:hypothetical protein IHE33_12475 (plasmid) [Mycetohabitans endofungorum]|uniref:hypothetical protein n=1 Tax=Mycetohabitans endofungorum TaxID=417203 RepID=UPI0030CFEF74
MPEICFNGDRRDALQAWPQPVPTCTVTVLFNEANAALYTAERQGGTARWCSATA